MPLVGIVCLQSESEEYHDVSNVHGVSHFLVDVELHIAREAVKLRLFWSQAFARKEMTG